MKIYLNSVKEDWVIDRLKSEWSNLNKDITTKYIFNADIIWLIAPWTWKKVKNLKNKIIVCSIYHIDEIKFDNKDLIEFKERDAYINYYHVISKKTYSQLKKITNKPIFVQPFWVNKDIFFNINDSKNLRAKYNFKIDDFLIGSFQRDTEGADLKSPKLSKGPDRLVKIFSTHYQNNKNTKILLTGKRRNYVIQQLENEGIPFYYFEMVDFETLNDFYNCLDLYIVSSRYEGGPQAILESAITKTPIISTDVGVASEILSKESIYSMDNFQNSTPNVEYAYKNAKQFLTPEGIKPYIDYFQKIYEN